jgi:hypothetical protein
MFYHFACMIRLKYPNALPLCIHDTMRCILPCSMPLLKLAMHNCFSNMNCEHEKLYGTQVHNTIMISEHLHVRMKEKCKTMCRLGPSILVKVMLQPTSTITIQLVKLDRLFYL